MQRTVTFPARDASRAYHRRRPPSSIPPRRAPRLAQRTLQRAHKSRRASQYTRMHTHAPKPPQHARPPNLTRTRRIAGIPPASSPVIDPTQARSAPRAQGQRIPTSEPHKSRRASEYACTSAASKPPQHARPPLTPAWSVHRSHPGALRASHRDSVSTHRAHKSSRANQYACTSLRPSHPTPPHRAVFLPAARPTYTQAAHRSHTTGVLNPSIPPRAYPPAQRAS
ncbi:hypothetical protein HYPSUDRAFT_214225 [Hypholoma sublateritium FD-334 SS-4]|uniref:Uncharacterized protein n=1 Tax=Hypholoma sublateritium (strain FD-334 SS-4) TaxID=945553 RepID=A0A0D2PZT3_HYPSF|nr:hypothetical protein HYPSUDRAFT_214225 [Hypholoma sublateritium FD-334 SS-4]